MLSLSLILLYICKIFIGRSMVNKKSDGGSQVKESTDSNATLEEEDVRGNLK